MRSPGLALLSVLAALGGGALGSYCLNSVLVMGGQTAEWLEAHRSVYPAGLAVGCAVLAVGVAVPLWPLAAVGGAVAGVAASRYLWLNV